MGYLIWYNLLFVLPLVADIRCFRKSGLGKISGLETQYLNAVRLWGGIIMVLFGIFTLFV